MSTILGNYSSMSRIGITRQSYANIERFIDDNKRSIVKAHQGIDMLAQTMVMTIKGFAQAKSAGPVAANKRSNPALAYRIPVQRITGRYFAGWTQRRVRSGHWIIYNDAVEAYLIEYGIYQRVRRPILKMSLIGMLRFVQTTRTGDRFFDWVLAPRRKQGRFQSFNSRLGGTNTIGGPFMNGPHGSLPG